MYKKDDRGGSPEDKDNYLDLVKDMRASFKDKYLITIAAPASYWYLRHFHIAEMSEYLDWINVSGCNDIWILLITIIMNYR